MMGENFMPINFGVSRELAVSKFTELWGQPDENNQYNIVYSNVEYQGFLFNRVVIGFEDNAKDGYFNQARFFIARPVRKQAVVLRDSLSLYLSKELGYPITADYEENGNKFYKGGTSPEGIGFLFTIYTQRREGKWMTELRFGAFHKLKQH